MLKSDQLASIFLLLLYICGHNGKIIVQPKSGSKNSLLTKLWPDLYMDECMDSVEDDCHDPKNPFCSCYINDMTVSCRNKTKITMIADINSDFKLDEALFNSTLKEYQEKLSEELIEKMISNFVPTSRHTDLCVELIPPHRASILMLSLIITMRSNNPKLAVKSASTALDLAIVDMNSSFAKSIKNIFFGYTNDMKTISYATSKKQPQRKFRRNYRRHKNRRNYLTESSDMNEKDNIEEKMAMLRKNKRIYNRKNRGIPQRRLVSRNRRKLRVPRKFALKQVITFNHFQSSGISRYLSSSHISQFKKSFEQTVNAKIKASHIKKYIRSMGLRNLHGFKASFLIKTNSINIFASQRFRNFEKSVVGFHFFPPYLKSRTGVFVNNIGPFEDVDECADGTHECSPDAVCINYVGFYECSCNLNFMGDGRTCEKAPEPTESNCSSSEIPVFVVNEYECVEGSSGDSKGYKAAAIVFIVLTGILLILLIGASIRYTYKRTN